MPIVAHHPMINYRSDRTAPSTSAKAVIGSLARTLRLWRSRVRERRAFTTIDDRELHDLGLSRYDVERELAKPFWRG
jgi:uncharacterized protein YjiS (DUF1127 family)